MCLSVGCCTYVYMLTHLLIQHQMWKSLMDRGDNFLTLPPFCKIQLYTQHKYPPHTPVHLHRYLQQIKWNTSNTITRHDISTHLTVQWVVWNVRQVDILRHNVIFLFFSYMSKLLKLFLPWPPLVSKTHGLMCQVVLWIRKNTAFFFKAFDLKVFTTIKYLQQ